MYAELLNQFENKENLAGKAWQHALSIDLIEKQNIKDCSFSRFSRSQVTLGNAVLTALRSVPK